VHIGLSGNDGIAGVALLDEPQIRTLDASMMASVEDVVAYVTQCRNILQIRARGVAVEEAHPATKMSFDDETGIVKLTRVGLCCALVGSKYPELDTVGVPERGVPRVLPKRGV